MSAKVAQLQAALAEVDIDAGVSDSEDVKIRKRLEDGYNMETPKPVAPPTSAATATAPRTMKTVLAPGDADAPRATGTTEGLEEQDREEARSERRRNGIGGGREERDDFVERDDARGERRPEDDEEGPVDVAEANGQHEDLPQRHRLRVAPHGRARG